MLGLWIFFFFSMIYGRLWCGWACPQTVLSELYGWFKEKIWKALNIKKNDKSLDASVILGYGLMAVIMGAISLIVGFNLVAYFVDPYRMLSEIASFSLNPVITGIILAIAFLVFVDTLFWREMFCLECFNFFSLTTKPKSCVSKKNEPRTAQTTKVACDVAEWALIFANRPIKPNVSIARIVLTFAVGSWRITKNRR
jgi:hypothetical protein